MLFWVLSMYTILHNREASDQFSVSVQVKAKINFRLGIIWGALKLDGGVVTAQSVLGVASAIFAAVYKIQPSSLAKRRNMIVSTRRYVIASTHERIKDSISTINECIADLSERCTWSNTLWVDDSNIDQEAVRQYLDECLLLAELFHHRATIRFDKHGLLFVGKPWSANDPTMIMSPQENEDRKHAQKAFESALSVARKLVGSELSQVADAEQFAFVSVRLADYYCYSRRDGHLEKAKELFADVIHVFQRSRWDPEADSLNDELNDSLVTPLYFFAKARLEEESSVV